MSDKSKVVAAMENMWHAIDCYTSLSEYEYDELHYLALGVLIDIIASMIWTHNASATRKVRKAC
jgi:hypothetical protein